MGIFEGWASNKNRGLLALIFAFSLLGCKSTYPEPLQKEDRHSLEKSKAEIVGIRQQNGYPLDLDNNLRVPPAIEAKVFYFNDTKSLNLNLSDDFDEAELIPILAGVVGAAIIGGAGAATVIKRKLRSFSPSDGVDLNRALSKQLSRLKNEDYVAIRAKRIGEPAPFSGHELDTKLPLYHEVKRLDSLGDLKEGEVSYVIFKDQQTADKTFAKADVPLFEIWPDLVS